ncbi:cupin domain-containing protein [Pararhodobacter marinus]|uniref:cupin domain-containing protein n=1 Tax=Pararhodobacter marinus TaxID=2184063 RepID=UPI0035132B81
MSAQDLAFYLSTDDVEPVVSRPDPDQVVSGDPVHTSWDFEDRDGLYCGMWQSTPGAWRFAYEEWEYIRVHSGRSVLTCDDGTVIEMRAGDSVVIRPGLSGIWEVTETMLKDYVIRT